jgi:secreted trypsin-like serine protease
LRRDFKQFFSVCYFQKINFALHSDELCGVTDKSAGLVVGGNDIEANEFPWGVAIFQIMNRTDSKFICGGTLITKRKVITAAHCLHRKYSTATSARDLELGVYNLQKRHGRDQKRHILKLKTLRFSKEQYIINCIVYQFALIQVSHNSLKFYQLILLSSSVLRLIYYNGLITDLQLTSEF